MAFKVAVSERSLAFSLLTCHGFPTKACYSKRSTLPPRKFCRNGGFSCLEKCFARRQGIHCVMLALCLVRFGQCPNGLFAVSAVHARSGQSKLFLILGVFSGRWMLPTNLPKTRPTGPDWCTTRFFLLQKLVRSTALRRQVATEIVHAPLWRMTCDDIND